MKVQLLIPAAGMGRRLRQKIPKALVKLGGRALICWVLERLYEVCSIHPILVVIPEMYRQDFEMELSPTHLPIQFVSGGEERQDSVKRGLAVLHQEAEIVVIHDAARPFPPLKAVEQAIKTAENAGAATLAIPVNDTILQSDDKQMLVDTPDRTRLWQCQTPQVFRSEVIRKAYAWAEVQQLQFTDDATLVRSAGFPVRLLTGDPMNFKITTEADLLYAGYLREKGFV